MKPRIAQISLIPRHTVALNQNSWLWCGNTPSDLFDLFYKSAVWIPMVLERQTTEARERIRQAIITGAERFGQSKRIASASPALMVTALSHNRIDLEFHFSASSESRPDGNFWWMGQNGAVDRVVT